MSCEIRGLREAELEPHARLVYGAYKEYVQEGRAGVDRHDWWLRSVRRDPNYSPEQTRVLVLDGEIVASVGSYLRFIHCAGRRAKVGAIGSVATHPDHRRKGYIRQVLAEARRWMRDSGFDFSFLFGREEVYGGSGWRMFSAFETIASVRPPAHDLGLGVRRAGFPADVPALASVYDEFNAPLTGPFVRSQEYWERRVAGGYFHDYSTEYYLLEEDRETVGYFRSGNPGAVSEIGWRRRGDLPARVVGTVLAQWPDITETHFGLCTRELLCALEPFTWAPTAAAYSDKHSAIRLVERYKGLWSYIGPGEGAFPEVSDTESLLRFLRANEYVFWSGVDGF